MNSKALIGSIMGVVIGVILLGSLLAPTISDVTETQKTFDNTDYARHQMKELESGDTWTRSDGTWYYNDEVVTTNSTGSYSVLFTDNLTIREVANIRGVDYRTGANSTTSAEIVTVDESTLGISINESVSATSFNYGYGAVPSGDYIMKDMVKSAYVLKDTDMYVTGVTNLVTGENASELLFVISGSIEDGFTVSVQNVKNSTVTDITVGEVTVNATPVDGVEDVYLFTNITFDFTGTYDGTETTTTATYGTFVMPKTVTAELSVHMTDAQNDLIKVLPVLVVVALFMVFVGAFIIRNRD